MISQICPLPIILYNVPGRTASNITAETTLRLANDFENIVAIKEASEDLVQIETIINDRPNGFLVLLFCVLFFTDLRLTIFCFFLVFFLIN